MLIVVVLLIGSVAAWILVDHLIAQRNERMSRGSGAWNSQFGTGRAFHSTGFEDTQPPAAELPEFKSMPAP